MRTGGGCQTAKREISRFPCEERPYVPGVYDHARPAMGQAICAPDRVAFPTYPQGRRLEGCFRGSIPSPHFPSPTLHPCPRGHRRTERGRSGWLDLDRKALASSTPRRFNRRTGNSILGDTGRSGRVEDALPAQAFQRGPTSTGSPSRVGPRVIAERCSASTCSSRVGERRGDLGPVAIVPFPLSAHRTGLGGFHHTALQPTSCEGMRRVSTLPQPTELEDPAVAKDVLGRELQ